MHSGKLLLLCAFGVLEKKTAHNCFIEHVVCTTAFGDLGTPDARQV